MKKFDIDIYYIDNINDRKFFQEEYKNDKWLNDYKEMPKLMKFDIRLS